MKNFFQRDSEIVAEELLGKILVRNIPELGCVKCRITETECYRGTEDKASHAYGGRRTKRNEAMYMDAGTIYVYFTYGMYYMLNIVTGKAEYPDAVLIRSVVPVSDQDVFAQKRFGKKFTELNRYQKINLLNGPGKLTKALEIDQNLNKSILGENLYIEDDGFTEYSVERTPRIGINYAKEWKDRPYRFVLKLNKGEKNEVAVKKN